MALNYDSKQTMNRLQITTQILSMLLNQKDFPTENPKRIKQYNQLKKTYNRLYHAYEESWEFLFGNFIKAMNSEVFLTAFTKNLPFMYFHRQLEDFVIKVLKGDISKRNYKISAFLKFPLVLCDLVIKYDLPLFKGKLVNSFVKKDKNNHNIEIPISSIKKLLDTLENKTVNEVFDKMIQYNNFAIIFSQDKLNIAVIEHAKLRILSIPELKVISTFKFDHIITALEVRDNQFIIGFQTGLIIIYPQNKKLRGHNKSIDHIFILKHLIISISSDKFLRIWDGDVCLQIIHYGDFNISRFKILSEGFVYASNNGNLFFWNIEEKHKEFIKTRSSIIYLNCIELIYPDKIVFLTYNNEIGTWNLENGERTILKTFKVRIENFKILKHDKIALLIDSKVYIWSMETQELDTKFVIHAINIDSTEDGELIVELKNYVIQVWK